MRTVAEIQAQMNTQFVALFNRDINDGSDDAQHTRGMYTGFRTGWYLTLDDDPNEAIIAAADEAENGYVSRGDSGADAWQEGYVMALRWCTVSGGKTP